MIFGHPEEECSFGPGCPQCDLKKKVKKRLEIVGFEFLKANPGSTFDEGVDGLKEIYLNEMGKIISELEKDEL